MHKTETPSERRVREAQEAAEEAVNAVERYGSAAAAARALGVPIRTFRDRLARGRRGLQAQQATPAKAGGAEVLQVDKDATVQALRQALAEEQARKVAPAPQKRKPSGRAFVRVIIPDTHGAFIDEDAAAAMLADIAQLTPAEVVLLGDHVDCAGFLSQHHTLGHYADSSYTYSDDLRAANGFLDQLMSVADSAVIYYLEGNHENRVERWCIESALRKEEDARMLLEALAPQYRLALQARGIQYIPTHNTDYSDRVGGALQLGDCWFHHGISYATNAAAVHARKFGAPVVFGHTHRIQSFGTAFVARSTDVCSWSVGCLCRLARNYQRATPHEWQHGYGVQLVSEDGSFQHITVHIHRGRSMLAPLIDRLV